MAAEVDRSGSGSLYSGCLRALLRRLASSSPTPSPSSSSSTPCAPLAPSAVLPDTVLLDLYQMMFEENIDMLSFELSDIHIFHRILKTNHSRLCLLRYFQAVIEQGINLSKRLSDVYIEKCNKFTSTEKDDSEEMDTLIDLGLRLGGFLNDAGWYGDAEIVLLSCKDVCQNSIQATHYIKLTLECCHRLLHAQSSYRNFTGAAVTYTYCLMLIELMLKSSQSYEVSKSLTDSDIENFFIDDEIEDDIIQGIMCKSKTQFYCSHLQIEDEEMNNLLLRLYKEFALFHFLKSDYNHTFSCSLKALRLLKPDTPLPIVIDVLRICSKGCVIMRKFGLAELLIQQAVARARICYGHLHPKYAFTLLDYGYYFLNIDCILNSVTVYEEALAVLCRIYNGRNLPVAQAHEDLSYALYVHEYASGRFYKARDHIDRAIKIMESLLPGDHLMLATTKRVKALILEEIALDNANEENNNALFVESETLHKSALKLSLDAFGEMNVQTAKHYGNLGRLYQSMKKYSEAESMQLRAISIKEKLLGNDDYEVGLSLGHLASLYNYHMKMFTAAEKLYYRSISISLKSFGDEYSGLEYDYIGLINVNREMKRTERIAFYMQLLSQWKQLRELSAEKRSHPDFGQEIEIPIIDLKHEVFDDVY